MLDRVVVALLVPVDVWVVEPVVVPVKDGVELAVVVTDDVADVVGVVDCELVRVVDREVVGVLIEQSSKVPSRWPSMARLRAVTIAGQLGPVSA